MAAHSGLRSGPSEASEPMATTPRKEDRKKESRSTVTISLIFASPVTLYLFVFHAKQLGLTSESQRVCSAAGITVAISS